MKPARRLLSEGATEFERQLLRSVVQERPSALHRARTAAGHGPYGARVLGCDGASHGRERRGQSSSRRSRSGSDRFGYVALARDTLAARAREARVEVTASAVSAPAPVAAPVPVEPVAVAADEPDAPSSEAPATVVEEPMSALRAQIELLDEARSAVGEHDPHRALALLARYDRDFPSGDFAARGSPAQACGPKARAARLRALVHRLHRVEGRFRRPQG